MRSSRRLNRDFFNQPTLRVAEQLLGKLIVRSYRGRLLAGIVTETEAYIGPADRAAHSYLHPGKAPQRWHRKFEPLLARHGVATPQRRFEQWAARGVKITPRNIAEYLDGGHVYIYRVYGMYWQLNFSTAGEGAAECVLIRSIVPVRVLPGRGGAKKKYELLEAARAKANGPGKLCDYLKLDNSFYGEDATRSKRLWLTDVGVTVPRRVVQRGPRIGISYAGPVWAGKPWRFWVEAKKVIAQAPTFP